MVRRILYIYAPISLYHIFTSKHVFLHSVSAQRLPLGVGKRGSRLAPQNFERLELPICVHFYCQFQILAWQR